MLNKTAKLALVATSLAPICLTLWFVEFSKNWDWQQGWGFLLAALLMSSVVLGGQTALSFAHHLPIKPWAEKHHPWLTFSLWRRNNMRTYWSWYFYRGKNGIYIASEKL